MVEKVKPGRGPDTRATRLAEALRDNLRKRKARSRGKAGEAGAPEARPGARLPSPARHGTGAKDSGEKDPGEG